MVLNRIGSQVFLLHVLAAKLNETLSQVIAIEHNLILRLSSCLGLENVAGEILDSHLFAKLFHGVYNLLVVLYLSLDLFVLSSHFPLIWGRGAHDFILAFTFLKVNADVNKTSSYFRCLFTAIENHFYMLCHNLTFFAQKSGFGEVK